MTRRWTIAATVVVGGFLGLFYIFPLVSMLERGMTADGLRDTLGRSATWRIVWFTVWQAALSTIATFVVGLPIAGVIARYEFRGRGVLRLVATVPFVLPTVVVASAFLSLERAFGLGDGPLAIRGSVWGIIAAHVFFNVAVVVRTVGGWWEQLDDRPMVAARTLGASPVRAFIDVTLPRLRPALSSAAAIVFLFTFSSFGVILLLGDLRRATIETEIWRYAVTRIDFETAAALALVQLVVVVTMLLVNQRLQGRLGSAEPTARVSRRRVRSGRERLGVIAIIAMAVAVLVGPLTVLVERSVASDSGYSLGFYRALADDDPDIALLPVAATTAVWNSLSWAFLATVIATVVGTLAAVLVTSRHRRLAKVTDIGLLLPLGTSAVLVGFGMLIALDTPPVDWRARWWIVPVAQALIGVPFVMRTVAAALRAIDPSLREAAATMGAKPRQVWREIDLPIASRAMVAGAAFAFAVSVGEFGATSFLARPQRPTIPTAIFRLLGRPGSAAFGQAMALSVILVVVTAAAVAVIERLRTAVSGEL